METVGLPFAGMFEWVQVRALARPILHLWAAPVLSWLCVSVIIPMEGRPSTLRSWVLCARFSLSLNQGCPWISSETSQHVVAMFHYVSLPGFKGYSRCRAVHVSLHQTRLLCFSLPDIPSGSLFMCTLRSGSVLCKCYVSLDNPPLQTSLWSSRKLMLWRSWVDNSFWKLWTCNPPR